MLGFVSLLMDISSELIHSLLPLFLASGLGVGALAIGLLEGLAESTALIVKVFSGALSDRFGRRKGLAVLGYGLGAVSKPLFALAPGAGLVYTARLLDRVGKGIRGAPRDALVADLTPQSLRGAAYGLRQSLDTVGAFLGPLLAVVLMLWWAGDFRAVFWFAVLPAVLSVALLAFGLREPPRRGDAPPRANPFKGARLGDLGSGCLRIVAIGALMGLARFSEAFLILRAADSGLGLVWAPMVLVVMNLAYSLSAYPFGALSDRLGHARLLSWGLGVLIVADLVLAAGGHWAIVMTGVALWGVHMGMTQGLLAAMLSTAAPAALRGTAFGLFGLAMGVAALAASLLAGLCWEWLGPPATFMSGALLAGAALLGVYVLAPGENPY